MRKPIERIIIAGGGSAGWMSAAMLSKQFPDMQIALVESPDIPTVGVGESTLGTINSFMDALGLKDTDWMKEDSDIDIALNLESESQLGK